MDRGRAVDKLRSLGLSENVEEYYESIWQKADDEIQRHHGNGSNALGLIASSMHLLDGAIYPGLLCNAFPKVFSEEYVVARDISILSPLLRSALTVHVPHSQRFSALSSALKLWSPIWGDIFVSLPTTLPTPRWGWKATCQVLLLYPVACRFPKSRGVHRPV